MQLANKYGLWITRVIEWCMNVRCRAEDQRGEASTYFTSYFTWLFNHLSLGYDQVLHRSEITRLENGGPAMAIGMMHDVENSE
jgi:hypothetical protein